MATGHKYRCRCGAVFELRKRVTLTKRRCPECGRRITTAGIDRQRASRENTEAIFGCVALLIVAAFVAVILKFFAVI